MIDITFLSFEIYTRVFNHLDINNLLNLYQVNFFKKIVRSYIEQKDIKNILLNCVYNENISHLKILFSWDIPITISIKGTINLLSSDDLNIFGLITTSYSLFTYAVLHNKLRTIKFMLEYQDNLLKLSENNYTKSTIYDIEETFFYNSWEAIYQKEYKKIITPLDISIFKNNNNVTKLLKSYNFRKTLEYN